ncbi:MAG: phosphoribosylglycinamide formyltransferase, partial [Cyanobacteria bacterium PR.023]|nr:phosphoribosylglycinamide formyltransferase [Cyanobacteria bacterium PR.023]
MPIKIAVLVSGRGSNLEAILAAIEKKELEAEIAVVLSNNPDSYALRIAKKHNIPTVSVDHRGISRKEHEKQVLQKLKKFAPDYLVLAGYMRILSGDFLTHFKDDNGLYRVINIHPSLLPAFPGKSAYEDAFNYGVKISGITVHLVDEQVDHGPILAQGVFERKSGDTLETFQARGLELEHKLFPQVLAQLANSSLAAMTNLNQENQKETAETKISTSNEHNEDLCVAIVPKAAAAAGKLTSLALPLYWLSGKNLEQTKKLMAALKEILADQLLEDVWCVVASERSSWLSQWREQGFKWFAERQYLPGVTDNLARTVEEAIKLSGLETSGKETTEEGHIRVASGSAYLFDDSLNIKQVENHCRYRHYHPVTDKFRI